MARSSRAKLASVYAIPLKDGHYGFAQAVAGGDFAFFDLRRPEIPPVEEIVSSPVAFRVAMAPDAHRQWKLLGAGPLHESLAQEVPYWHRPVGATQPFLYFQGRSTPATEEQVRGLEVLATWFSMHAEERLEDHFAGRPNVHKESLERF